MKRISAVILSLIFAFSLIPAAHAAKVYGAPAGYSVSGGYSSSVYYSRLKEVRLTGNQRLDIINAALSQVGYHEGNGVADLNGMNSSGSMNYTEYGYYFGMEVLDRGTGFFYEWCAMFAVWSARMARLDKSIINNATYAHVGANPYFFHMPFHPRGTYIPRTGDLIFYDWANNGRDWDHVGIVLYVENGRVHVVEGNARDSVILRDISLYDSEIQGFGSPAYTCAMASAVEVSSYSMPEDAIKPGQSGDGVRWLQSALLHLGYPCPIDGNFGENTLRLLKLFQTRNGISATGTCGPATKAKIKAMLAAGTVASDDPAAYRPPQRVLTQGCVGDDVKWLQSALKKIGASLNVDGEFGPGTRTAVIWAQKKLGLTQDGKVGPITRDKLAEAIKGGSAPSSDPSRYPVPTRLLSYGSSGEDVKWLQAVLTQNGLTMNMTGYFGDKTRNYVKAFQRSHGLTPDGMVGPATLAKLKAAAGGSGSSGSISWPEPARELKKGCKGNDVKWLQAALNKLGYSLTVDGAFGSGTESRLKDFQRAAGIAADGKCGPITRKAIKNRL